MRQARRLLERVFGSRLHPYLYAAGGMARAVVYALLLTAVLQGAVAGRGYWIVGLQAPILLGAATAIASIIPVEGTFLVWGSLAALLFATGHRWPAVGLLAWGTVLVHPADNIIRPLVIGAQTDMSVLAMMLGIVGGLAAFGLIGLFAGPVILALATAVWREWLGNLPDDRPTG